MTFKKSERNLSETAHFNVFADSKNSSASSLLRLKILGLMSDVTIITWMAT